MSTPTGYPGSNEPFGPAGRHPSAGPAGQYPPPGQYDQSGYQQPGYPPAPQYAAPQYGAPAYPTGPAGYGAPVGTVRPGMVTAAAVLAFIWGGLGILFGLIGLAFGSILSSASNAVCNSSSLDVDTASACNTVSGAGTFLIIVTIGTIIVAGLMIWGGVVALNGKNGQILVIACAVYAALALLSIFASSFGFTSLLGFVIPVLIVVFLLNSQSKTWFKARGGKTF